MTVTRDLPCLSGFSQNRMFEDSYDLSIRLGAQADHNVFVEYGRSFRSLRHLDIKGCGWLQGAMNLRTASQLGPRDLSHERTPSPK